MRTNKKYGGRRKPRVFISYRRDDANVAARITDYLRKHLGKDNVFQDLTSLRPGAVFVEETARWIDSCTAIIVIISKSWSLDRLRSEADYVRQEIKLALQRKLHIYPLLLDGASLPKASELPEDIRSLVHRNAIDLPQLYFQEGLQKLLQAIRPSPWKNSAILLTLAIVVIALAGALILYHSPLVQNTRNKTLRSSTGPVPGGTPSASIGRTLQVPGVSNRGSPKTYSDVVTLPAGSSIRDTRVFAKELNVPEWTGCQSAGGELVCGNGPERIENLKFVSSAPHIRTSASATTVSIEFKNWDVRGRQVRLEVEYDGQTPENHR